MNISSRSQARMVAELQGDDGGSEGDDSDDGGIPVSIEPLKLILLLSTPNLDFFRYDQLLITVFFFFNMFP